MEVNTYWTHESLAGSSAGLRHVQVEAPAGAKITGGGAWAAFATEEEQIAPFFPVVGIVPVSDNVWSFAFQVPAVPTNADLIRAHCFVVALEDSSEE